MIINIFSTKIIETNGNSEDNLRYLVEIKVITNYNVQ